MRNLNQFKAFAFIITLLCFSGFHSHPIRAEVLITLDSDVITPPVLREVSSNISYISSDNIRVVFPIADQNVFKSSIKLKGVNRYLSPSFINGKALSVKQDGRFYEEFNLDSLGQNDIVFTFILPDFSVQPVRRSVLQYHSPEALTNSGLNSNQMDAVLGFYNSPYIKHGEELRDVNSQFSRADLAYFLYRVTSQNIEAPEFKYPLANDVEGGHWAWTYIKWAQENGVMAEYPDGAFRPDSTIKTIEYVISLVRAKELELNFYLSELPFQDLESNWTTKFINTAFYYDLLPAWPNLMPNKELTVLDFIMLADHLELEKVSKLTSNNVTVQWPDLDETHPFIAPALEKAFQLKSSSITRQQVDLLSPYDKQVFISEPISVKGYAPFVTDLKINGNVVTMNLDSLFEMDFQGEIGPNVIYIEALGQRVSRNVFVLDGYADLKSHWVALTAAKLKYLNIGPSSSDFNPKQSVTRLEVAAAIQPFLSWTVSSNFVEVSDVATSNSKITAVRAVVAQRLMSLDTQDRFRGEDEMTRAQLASVLAKLVAPKSDSELPKLPYKDVKQGAWYERSIKVLLDSQVISPSSTFNPGAKVSRAQLYTFISRLPKIKDQLDVIFK